MKKMLFGLFLAILSTILYTIMDASIKWSLSNYNISTEVFYFNVNLLIFFCIFIFGYILLKNNLLFIGVSKTIIIVRGVVAFLNFYLAYVVLQRLPLDIYYSIIFIVPTLASILSVFLLKEKLDFIKILSLVIGFVGIIVITNPFNNSFNFLHLVPIFITLILALSISLAMVMTKKYFTKENNISVSFYIFLICTIIGFALSLIKTNFIVEKTFITNQSVLVLVIITAVSCFLGFLTFMQAYKSTPVQFLVPTEYLYIIWGSILGYIIFKDTITTTTIIGAIIVIISNALIFLEKPEQEVK
jgi:drug/metabolite transporter (DMT)-like permease